ncbi:MAG: hypothetical protein IKW85_04675 [Muribaculaceae bacterium]|nr:hypothetical protein [Muribaculaceae bacterium]
MKNLLTFFLTALLAFGVGWAETVTFVAGTDVGSTTNTSNDSMTKDGITISSTSAGLAYPDYRFYNGTITISSTNGEITSVAFTCTSSSYANVLSGSTPSVGSFSLSGTTVTWTGSSSSFTIRNAAQTRASQIVVTTSGASSITEVATIAEAYGTDPNTQFVFTGNAVVTYQNGSNLWIRDGSGSGLIYGSGLGTYNNGDILNTGWKATNVVYNGIPEFSSPSNVGSSTNVGTVDPLPLSTLTNDDINKYASLSNVTVTSASGNDYYIQIGGTTFHLRNQYGLVSLTQGKTYNVTGIVTLYNNEIQFNLLSATEVSTGDPLLLVSTDELTISDSGVGNTFTVEGSYLGNDNVGVTVPVGSFSTTTDDQWWGFINHGGSVNGTVTVNYTGRDLSATGTVRVANNIIETFVNVTYVADLFVVGNYGSGWDFSAGAATAMTNSNGIYTATLTNVPADSRILFTRKTGETYNWENDANRLFIGADTNGGDWRFGDNTSGNLDTDPTNDNPVKYHPIWFPEAGTYTITIDASNGTFTITKETESSDDFVLVTNVNDLNAGNEVIIVNKGEASNEARTMGQRNTNNYYGTAVTVTNALKVTATESTQIFTLEAGTGGWYFKTSDDQYLNSTTGTSNQLQTKDKDGNGTGTSLATITIGSGNAASVVFQGSGQRKNLRYNANNGVSTNTDIFSCYASGQQPVYIYQRQASAEPSITVDESSLSFVNPADGTPQSQTVTVTENNTTGTTSVNISGTGAANYSATLENGTLTVTYSGTATQNNPDEATITLTNGTASATVTVTGYKLPMTVAITPADGHTFSGTTVSGMIESNVADAVIEYSFDGTNWQTYDADDGFITPEVTSIGGTITVYARASHNGETVTAQVTYTRVAQTTTCTADIIFDPQSNNGEMSQWNTFVTHIGEGTEYISGGTVTKVWTSSTYESMRFGSGNYTGEVSFTLDLSAFGGSCKLIKVTINAARYGNDSGCELKVSTDVDTNGKTVSITAPQDNFADYVFNFDGSEINTLTIANTAAGARVYVHSIELTYNCASETVLSLSDLVNTGVVNENYTISDELVAAKVTWDDNQHKFAIFAKDDEGYANKRYPTDGQEEYLIEYQNQDKTFTNAVEQRDYDQSNWIEILIPTEVVDKTADPSAYQAKLDLLKNQYENKLLKASAVKGTYVDALNPTIVVGDAPEVESGSEYTPNIYCTANFLMENIDADGALSYREDDLGGQYFFFMDAKPHEECLVVWAYYVGGDSYFVAPAREGNDVNGWQFRGSFKADMSLCEDANVTSESSVENCFEPSNSSTYGSEEMLYGFDAIVRKNPASSVWAAGGNGAPRRIQPYADGMETDPAYIVYPLNAGSTSSGNVTAVKELIGKKVVESVRYYNVIGVESAEPFEGVNIVVTRYNDGTVSTAKVIR